MYNQIILIPIGGVGSRFKKNNYNRPKALINVFGKPLIYYLISNLKVNDKTLIYIPYNHEYQKYRFEDSITILFPKIQFKFLHLRCDTEGAAQTINIALNNLSLVDDLPILCLDSDSFYTTDVIKLWNKKNIVFYFKDQNPNPIYSYLELGTNSKISDMIEKQKISDNACCGAYGFQSSKDLLKYTASIIENNIRHKSEFYTSVCIHQMILDNIDFYGIMLEKKDFHSLGTPIQLKQFYNNTPRISCLTDKQYNLKLRICFDLDNTLVSYPKIDKDYSSVLPIEENIKFLKYLKNFGHTIIIYTSRRMKTHVGNQGRLLADIGKITFDTLEKFEIPFDEIYFGKPDADFYIDDKAISVYENLEKELGFYLDNIQPRDFNSIEQHSIEIFTKKSEDLSGEIFYYLNIPKDIKDMFPLFIDYDIHNKWYSVEKINGLTLSNMYLSELMTTNLLEHVMNSIKRIQNTQVNDTKDINIYFNYLLKLKERYHNYDYSNYTQHNKVYQILKAFLEKYENDNLGKKVCIHGDTVFTNIIINQYDKLKFIDMRGRLGKQLSIHGDWLYDWSKMYQSLLGYDEILLDKELSKDYKNKMLNFFKNKFLEWYSEADFKNLQMITNSLIFTLIPIHDNEKCYSYYQLIDL